MTRKQNIFNENSNENYCVWIEVVYNKNVLKSNLCNYNDAYVLVRGNISIMIHQSTQAAFKSCAPFTKCITKINGTTTDDAENLDLVISMYNLMKYSSNYSETTESLWFYSKDEGTDFIADIAKTTSFISFMYNSKLLENTGTDGANGILKNARIAVSFKYLSNFWRSLKYH